MNELKQILIENDIEEGNRYEIEKYWSVFCHFWVSREIADDLIEMLFSIEYPKYGLISMKKWNKVKSIKKKWTKERLEMLEKYYSIKLLQNA